MSGFDPFSATLEQAIAEDAAAGTAGLQRSAVARWISAQGLTRDRVRHECNPLNAVAICVRHGLVTPEWLARAFSALHEKVLNCEVRSWDEAFGAPFPRGANLPARKRASSDRAKVVGAVWDQLKIDPSSKVDKGFFDEIGRHVGVGATRAEELYREAIEFGMLLPLPSIRDLLTDSSPAKLKKGAGLQKP